jgi:hypothetical protein
MRHTLQLILAFALALLSYAYFAWVLPPVVAVLIGLAFLIIAMHAMISGQFRLPLLGGPVLLAWPAGAVLASLAVEHVFAGELSRDRALAVSWVLPLLAWKLSYAISQRRDQARDLGGMAIAVIVVYVSVAALLSGDLMALMLASLGAGAAAFVAHQHLILPPNLEAYLLRLGGAGWGAALLFGVRWLWA